MQTRQRAILLVLVFLSLLQQGVRWQLGIREASTRLENPVVVMATQGVVQAASSQTATSPEAPPQAATAKRHCPLVHVNTAGMAELQTLPGIGPVYAERIIIARKEQPFLEKRDLLRVSGIGEKRLAQIENLICLFFEPHAETE